MIWYLRSRVLSLTVGVTALGEVVVLIGGSTSLPLPSFGTGSMPVPIALLAPIGVCVVVATALGRGPQLESAAVRHLRAIDVVFVATHLATVMLLSIAMDRTIQDHLALAFARNVVALVGLVLLLQPVGGRAVAAIPAVAYVLISALLGATSENKIQWWAVPIAPATSTSSWALSACLLFAGVVVYLANAVPPAARGAAAMGIRE